MPGRLAHFARAASVAAALALSAAGAGAANLSGAYLAAMQADFRNDYATAAEYYARALEEDAGNPVLMQNAVMARVAAGDAAGASDLAERLFETDPENGFAPLVLLADALAQEDFEAAATLLEAGEGGGNPLLDGLIGGWIAAGREDFTAGFARFDAMGGNAALEAFGQYHKALALGLAGDFVSAATILQGGEDGPLHLNRGAIIAHAQVLAQIGREVEAMDILDDALAGGIPDAALADLQTRLVAGQEVAFDRVPDARAGAAEAFLSLAQVLDRGESERIALIHARLAAHVRPELSEAQLLAAELLEVQGQYDLAAGALANVPETSAWFVTAGIRRANTQREAGDPEAGIATLTELADSHPDQIEVHSALGDALRTEERYAEAVTTYSRAVDLVAEPQQAHWVIFYTRGIANERAGDWKAAEADFRKALELEPDQPLVLNYLGYSMVEQRRELDVALDMIERAVEGRPDDGYITDSLGWVLYRLGRFEEAVAPMLRAVELVPDDPVVNDHLGDVLWKVGREREAEFQWRRALSFGPADELDMDRVRQKLELGLDEVLAAEQAQTDG